MKEIIAYHCSPFKIDKFNFLNGVHFGGKQSALTAGKRKLFYLHKFCKHKNTKLYLHKVKIIVNSIEEVDDLGNGWVKYKDSVMVRDSIDALVYTNKYEPDKTKSYYIGNPSLCTVLTIEVI